MTVEVKEIQHSVVVSDPHTVEVTDSSKRQVIELRTAGPQGPQGPAGQGISSGLFSERPASGNDGDVFAATDTDELYVWFA